MNNPPQRLRLLIRIATAVYWIVLFVLTHVPVTLPKRGPSDKTIHFVSYALLGVMLWLSINPKRWMIGGTIAILMIYGAFDELTQKLVGRSCDFQDWLADTAGAIVAVLSCALLARLLESKRV